MTARMLIVTGLFLMGIVGCTPSPVSSERIANTDQDGDGYSPSQGDCDDRDPSVHPGAPEVCDNGIDDDCDGFIDGEGPDVDGDGFSPCEGDCLDSDPTVGPMAMEVPSDGVDNDCDGEVDEDDPWTPCDCLRGDDGRLIPPSPEAALGLCDARFVEDATFLHARSHVVVQYDPAGSTPSATGWGALHPIPPIHGPSDRPGCAFVVMSTGVPLNPLPQDDVDAMNLGYRCAEDPVTEISNPDDTDTPHPCYDLTQYRLVLRVPQNARSLSFDFLYLSSEYPEWIGSEYNDTFYAMFWEEGSSDGTLNISFDARGRAISVNNDFFEIPPNLSIDISGTGYDEETQDGTPVGSTTGWIRTTVPVRPGARIVLTFSIHDEGDQLLDSAVVIDHLRWTLEESDGPVTVE